MPAPPLREKTTKLQKLFAVFERFHQSIASVPDDTTTLLCKNWSTNKHTYATPPPGVRPSELVAGLEQALLELPMIVAAVAPAHRANVARALSAAVQAEHPTFFSAQEERLSSIIEKGRISSESQFKLVRHALDLLEGIEQEGVRLRKLYSLVDQYESRGRRR